MKKEINLSEFQKDFIENKVKQLGGIEAVKALYRKKCTVDSYARKFARKHFKKERKI